MVWMEDNICIYRYGEILHTSAVLVGTIHVIQGIYQLERTCIFYCSVQTESMPDNQKKDGKRNAGSRRPE